MPFYRKKPVVIQADRWWKNGDHPHDHTRPIVRTDGSEFDSEGEVVRYYRNPEHAGDSVCQQCGNIMHNHGWIDALEGGHIVCPGDYIITGVKGERYSCKPDIFEATYEALDKAQQ